MSFSGFSLIAGDENRPIEAASRTSLPALRANREVA